MSNKVYNTIKKLLIEPVQSNMASLFFWGGLLAVLSGVLIGTLTGEDSKNSLILSVESLLLKGGSAILGAGVFAVIMKSVQFTDIFQKHIFDVFYKPETVVSDTHIKRKWRCITNAMLKQVLPETYSEASEKIEQQFFDSELEYHFEDYRIFYNITVDEKTNEATIKLISKCTVILSPHCSNPILKQSIETFGAVKLQALRIDDVDVHLTNQYVYDKENKDKKTLHVHLKEHVQKGNNGDGKLSLEKVMEWTQDLSIDPYISTRISRYIKGATISFKISKGFKVFFERFGLGDLPKNHKIEDDGEGYDRWILARPTDLLLPGQGYILLIAALPVDTIR